jgi:hypothetical protein
MNSLILFVLHDPTLLRDILTAWEKTGVLGITILPSSGLHRLDEIINMRDDIPLIPSLEDLVGEEEILNRTIFTIVDNDTLIDRLVDVTQEIVGNLDSPNTGILCVIPLSKVYGLNRK